MSRYRLKQSVGTQYEGHVSAYTAYKAGVPLRMIDPTDPMQYHLCPVCKKPMKQVKTDNYGWGWVFDCKCLDGVPPNSGEVEP